MAENNKKKVILGGIFLGLIPLLFILYLILGPVLSVMTRDLSAKEMFVISDGVNVRAKPEAKALKMGRIKYGTKLLVYKIEDNWAEVLIEGQKGFVSKDYIAGPKTFYLLEGLFGDERSKKRVTKTQYRLALLRYLDEKGYITKIPEEYKKEFDDEDLNKEVYQIFSEPSKAMYNSFTYGDFDGDYVQDAAFVLRNPDTDNQLLVILSFDKNDPINKSKAIYEKELGAPWMFIRKAVKGSRWYLNDKVKEAIDEDKKPVKSRIKIDGIVISSNRNRNLHDPVTLLLYNGETFETHAQDIEIE
jgi:hypothetical protein